MTISSRRQTAMRITIAALLASACACFQPSFPWNRPAQRASPTSIFVTENGNQGPAMPGASTDMKPLYDGTNYTFPDTTDPAGIAELLEVSFVNACMQLRTGYVDVLKLFIVAAISGYEFGFSIATIEEALEACPKQTAGRPLMAEEITLRQDWLCVVYYLLSQMNHPTKFGGDVDIVPDSIPKVYGTVVERLVKSYAAGHGGDGVTVESLAADGPSDLSPLDQAVRLQTIRTAKLTLQVLQETEDARPGGTTPPSQPPTPPIEGAF